MAGVDRARPGGPSGSASTSSGQSNAAAVVGHEPGVGRDVPRELVEQGAARRHGRAAAAGPGGTRSPSHQPRPMQEGDGPGRRREPGRLGVEADAAARSGRRLPGQRRAAAPDRSAGRRSGRSTRTNRPPRPSTTSPSSGGGQPLGELRPSRSARGAGDRRARPDRGLRRAEALEPAGEVDARRRRVAIVTPAWRSAAAARLGARRRRARPAAAAPAPRASTSGSRRGPVQAGQPPSQPHAGDQLGGAGEQLVVALPQPLRQPDPAGHGLVQVDRRLLGVRRADLGDEARGRAGRPSAAPTAIGLDRPPGAEQRDVELVAPPVARGRASAVSQ